MKFGNKKTSKTQADRSTDTNPRSETTEHNQQNADTSRRRKNKTRKTHGVKDNIITIFWALVIALILRSFAFEPFNIPSGSMYPTLYIGDFLFVSKYPYGYSRYSFPLSLPLFEGRLIEDVPERGDVVVFRSPTVEGRDLIKRVIALPGETVQMREGRLYLNGELIERRDIGSAADMIGRPALACAWEEPRLFTEHLPQGFVHEIIETGDTCRLDNTEVITVPTDHYFVMGDNRDNSEDSRAAGVGLVPAENLIGRAEILWLSLDNARFWQIWRWPSALRFDRIFDRVE